MQNDVPAPPPPPPPSQSVSTTQELTDVTDEPTANGYMQNDSLSGLTQIALEMLAVMPSLF
jgi:hypothetical protein